MKKCGMLAALVAVWSLVFSGMAPEGEAAESFWLVARQIAPVMKEPGPYTVVEEGKGIEVVDLGTDVQPATFVDTAREQGCRIICLSALLTTTMGMMTEVVQAAREAGIRDQVKIMVGGAPVTDAFCQQIGADAYTPDAASAAEKAVEFLTGEPA